MDALLAKFEGLYSAGVGTAAGMAMGTFALVASIDFIWKVLKTLLAEENQIVLLIRSCVKYGMISALITNYASWSDLFLQSLMMAGAAIGGGSISGGDLKLPGTVFAKGLANLQPVLNALKDNITNIVALPLSLMYIVIYVMGIICYGFIAAQIFLTWVEWYIIGACAVIFLPFLANDNTKFMGEKAIGAVVAAGVKLMVMGVVASGVLEAINTMPMATDVRNSEAWVNIGTMFILAYLSWTAPGMAAGLLAGTPSLGGSEAISTAKNAGGNAGAAAGMAKTGIQKVGGTIMNAYRAATTPKPTSPK